MSLLNAVGAYRRGRPTPRVPVLMPQVDVHIDADGSLSILLDRERYAPHPELHRDDLQQVLADIAADLGTPIRVEVREADDSTFTDIVAPHSLDPGATDPLEHASSPVEKGDRDKFLPLEDVAVAVVVAHQTAGQDGVARLRLPPTLLEAHAGRLVLVGRQSGTVVMGDVSA
jgi:hypothetical protein